MCMKRKIRKKRQIRLQKWKEQRMCDRTLQETEVMEIDFYESLFNDLLYYKASESPYFLFVYVGFHFGWEIYKPIHMVFLCDILSHNIEYGNVWAKIKDDDNDEPIASCFEKLGNIYLDSEISVDNMLSCYPNDLICVYDCSYYEIYFKCGNRKRLLGIDTENQSKYIPFEWLIKLFNQVKKNNY